MKTKITKRLVDSLERGDIVWDTEVRGFGVRALASCRSYCLKVDVRGRSRFMTIGKHGSPWTVDEARREAKRLLGVIVDGADPAADKQAAKRQPTVADLCERYLEEHALEHKRPSSRESDERNIANHVLPLIGDLRVADVTRADVDRLKRSVKAGHTAADSRTRPRGRRIVKGGPGAANRVVALVSKMFNLAERWGWRPDGSNPCRHVEKYREQKLERFLSPEELARLGDALREAERQNNVTPQAAAAIRMLLFTGARRGEVLGLRWEHIDFDRACLRLPDSKTGAKLIHLPPPALEVLSALPRYAGCAYVFPAGRGDGPMRDLTKPWERVRTAAGLPDVRLHDLRHSFASVAVAGGLSLPMIGKLLGHTQAATTQRYAHLADDPVKAAQELVAGRIAEALGQGAGGQVVDIKGAGP